MLVKHFRVIVVLLLFSLILSSCQKKAELVNYQKPYLEITYKSRNDKVNIIMHDYETKQSKAIESFGLHEIMPSSLNPTNNDYLISSRVSCDILIILKNGSSKLFNPCKLARVPDNASLNDGIYYSNKYILITFNQGFDSNGKNYNYTLGIFNHKYQLVDTIKLKQQPYFFNLTDNTLYFITMENLFSGFNILNTYDITNKKLTTKKLSNTDTKDFFLINNTKYIIDDHCDLYKGNQFILKVASRCSSVQPTYQYSINSNIVIQNLFVYTNDSDEPHDVYLKIDINKPQNTKVVADLNCLNNQAWYSPQGKYCLSQKGNVVFNDYLDKPIELMIKPSTNMVTNYGFYNW